MFRYLSILYWTRPSDNVPQLDERQASISKVVGKPSHGTLNFLLVTFGCIYSRTFLVYLYRTTCWKQDSHKCPVYIPGGIFHIHICLIKTNSCSYSAIYSIRIHSNNSTRNTYMQQPFATNQACSNIFGIARNICIGCCHSNTAIFILSFIFFQ